MKYLSILLILGTFLLCLGGCEPHMWDDYNDTFRSVYHAGYVEGKHGNRNIIEGWQWFDNEIREIMGLK